MCFYGLFIGLVVANSIIEEKNLWNQTFKNLMTGESFKPSFSVVILFFFSNYNSLTFLVILCLVMAVCLGLFTVYHLNMIRGGLTSVENYKLHLGMSNYKERVAGLIRRQENANHDEKTVREAQAELNQINEEVNNILAALPKSGFWRNFKEILRG